MATKTIALVVEGVGRQTPTSGSSKGIAWCWGESSLDGTVVDNYEWIGGWNTSRGLVDAPQTIGTMVDPFDVTISGASFTFQLHKDTLAGEMWLPRPSGATGYLSSALTDTATGVALTGNNYSWSASDEGTVIWVGDEAILLGTYSAPSSFTGCTRGYYSTIAAVQPSGMNVYKRNPFRENRRAILIEYNHDTSTTKQLWQGFVTDFDANSPVINVNTVELLSVLKNGVINRGNPNTVISAGVNQTGSTINGFVDYSRNIARVASDTRVNKSSINTDFWVSAQFRNKLYYAKYDATTGRANFIDEDGTSSGGSTPQLGSLSIELDDEQPIKKHEVFVVDWAKDNHGVATIANARSSTRDLNGFPFHPVAIALGFLTSGYDDGVGAANGDYDVFGYEWGLGVPADWFNTTDNEALLSATQGSYIEQMVLGWDGEPVDAWPVIQNLLRCRGFFVGTDEEGKIVFARIRVANIADSCGSGGGATPIPYTLEWKPSEGEGVDQIRGRIGELPWDDGQPYQANVLGDTALLNPPNSLRAGLFNETRSFSLDLPYLRPFDDQTKVGGLISMISFRGQGSPRLTIRVVDNDYAIGDVVQVGDPGLSANWFVDADGNSVTPDGSAKWFGQVIGHQRNIKDGTITLTLLMSNWYINEFARFRAPSGECASVSTATYTLSSGVFTGDDDAEAFNVGDKVELWRPDGVRRSGTSGSPDVQEVVGAGTKGTAPGAHKLELDAAFTTAMVAGDVIRLAHLDDSNGYPESGHSGVSVGGVTINCGLAYVYAADSSETINPNDDAGHIYATGQL